MIHAINYATRNYWLAQKLNSRQALAMGADNVKEFTPKDIDTTFKEEHKDIFSIARGGGCWLWKPYIIKKALSDLTEGDYLVYTDAGSAFVQPIQLLIDKMEQYGQSVMVFCNDKKEYMYSKRDAFLLLEADCDEYAYSNQICGGYIIIQKNDFSVDFIDQYLTYCCDKRILTNEANVLGKDNYPGFVSNRHDQTVLSLLSKKNGILPFRDPSQWGNDESMFEREVIKRSDYPQMIESHRKSRIICKSQLAYYKEQK